MLKLNNLGSTDLKLSLLGLGTVKFGRNTEVKYPENFEIPSIDQIINLLNLAQSLGINTLDTAPAYGDSEQKLGEIFKNHLKREDWVLITKAGEEFNNNQSFYNFDANYINNSINTSLKNLRSNYIDILLIHSDGSDEKIANDDKLWAILEQRKNMGDIKAFGVSSKTVHGGLKCLERSDLAMITYREDYQDEISLLDYALNNNKGIILKKVLNSGHGVNQNLTAAQHLQFSSSHPAVTSMIIGTINPDHLRQNVKSLEI